MRVNIRVFARLRDIVGAAELARDVPTGTTAQRIWDDLVEEFPDISTYTGSISTAVNAEYAKMETVLDDGDEGAFLPPVSGGELPG